MGLLDIFRPMRSYEAAITAALADPATIPIGSPWSPPADLNRVVFEDIFGTDVPANTRASAMRLPAVSRGRNLLTSTIGRMPLAAANAAGPLPSAPGWMANSVDGTSPQHRLVWTVDDLIFYGWSCWWRENYADSGFPRAVSRINQGEWRINGDNQVEVRGTPAEPNQVILIPGFHEGVLSFGLDTIRDARSLYQIVRTRLASPVPPIDLHQTGGDALTDEQIDALIERWVTARASGKAVGYTSENIEVNVLEAGDAQLMIEARNAASLDLARVIGVTAGLIDATAPKASLNYETTTGRNQEFIDRDLALYMTPITARLSLDDVMPHGQRAVFDLTDFTAPSPAATGPVLED